LNDYKLAKHETPDNAVARVFALLVRQPELQHAPDYAVA
jgi:hypothetical protein